MVYPGYGHECCRSNKIYAHEYASNRIGARKFDYGLPRDKKIPSGSWVLKSIKFLILVSLSLIED